MRIRDGLDGFIFKYRRAQRSPPDSVESQSSSEMGREPRPLGLLAARWPSETITRSANHQPESRRIHNPKEIEVVNSELFSVCAK
jgi:hypothetical protein